MRYKSPHAKKMATVKIVSVASERKLTYDESCMALMGINVAAFVKELQRNQNGEYDDIFEDTKKKQRNAL